jgi:uncharacterized glyoxalase superfamily protein PhnB
MMNLMPFLLFDGNCAEAMAFYQSCLDGELAITKVCELRDLPFGSNGHLADKIWRSLVLPR